VPRPAWGAKVLIIHTNTMTSSFSHGDGADTSSTSSKRISSSAALVSRGLEQPDLTHVASVAVPALHSLELSEDSAPLTDPYVPRSLTTLWLADLTALVPFSPRPFLETTADVTNPNRAENAEFREVVPDFCPRALEQQSEEL